MYNEERSGAGAKKTIYCFFLVFFIAICIVFGLAVYHSMQKVGRAKDEACDSGIDAALFGLPRDACSSE